MMQYDVPNEQTIEKELGRLSGAWLGGKTKGFAASLLGMSVDTLIERYCKLTKV
jgi:hypothetical protein